MTATGSRAAPRLVEHFDGRLEIVAWTETREFDLLYPELPLFADTRDTAPGLVEVES